MVLASVLLHELRESALFMCVLNPFNGRFWLITVMRTWRSDLAARFDECPSAVDVDSSSSSSRAAGTNNATLQSCFLNFALWKHYRLQLKRAAFTFDIQKVSSYLQS